MKTTLGAEAIYRLLSGVAHGQFWALNEVGLRPVQDPDGRKAWEERVDEEIVPFIWRSLIWFGKAAWTLFSYRGWNLTSLASVLEIHYSQDGVPKHLWFWLTDKGR